MAQTEISCDINGKGRGPSSPLHFYFLALDR